MTIVYFFIFPLPLDPLLDPLLDVDILDPTEPDLIEVDLIPLVFFIFTEVPPVLILETLLAG